MKTIGIVDEEADHRTIFRIILEDHYRITEYASGAALLEGLRGSTMPDVVLLGISMRDMDGYQVLRRIREELELSALPVIAVADLGEANERRRCLEAGFDGFVAKPILDHESLLSAIAGCMGDG